EIQRPGLHSPNSAPTKSRGVSPVLRKQLRDTGAEYSTGSLGANHVRTSASKSFDGGFPMLNVSTSTTFSSSSVHAPANEAAEAPADQAAKLAPPSAASAPLNGIVPDGGLHAVARTATASQSTSDLQQMLQQVLAQLQNNAAAGSTATHPVSNARAQDPM